MTRARHAAEGLTLAAMLGVLEGWVYPTVEGPRVPEVAYWAVLAIVLWRVLPAADALTLFPLALVLQDCASLLAQGLHPFTATWYEHAFGAHPLTQHELLVPGWYVAAITLTLAMIASTSRTRLPRVLTPPSAPRAHLPGSSQSSTPGARANATASAGPHTRQSATSDPAPGGRHPLTTARGDAA